MSGQIARAVALVLGIGLGGGAAVGGEILGRGAVAMAAPDGAVYIAWRLLPSDPPDRAFSVWRREAGGEAVRLTPKPIADSTNAVDRTAKPGVAYRYEIRMLSGGAACATVDVGASREPGPAVRIAIGEGVRAQKVAIADLDGDGAYDYVIKQPDFNVDPYEKYWKKSQDTYKLEAYRSDGRSLWRRDLGWSIEEGIWYSPYVAYDLDGDGRAEVATKAGEGDPRDADGRVQAGPEWLLILDGATGEERARIPWPDRQGFESYNYYCRSILGVAYLDGKRPALIVVRGTYTIIKVRAYAFEGGALRPLWSWDAEGRYRGQGMHGLKAADVDGDGRDEVILGSAV
ncbi:MAG: FG-GAP repeat protein, partial [Planctomycetes bacterium]|nr:FG-GAP repeat protein [Planctomycetota bacterium]